MLSNDLWRINAENANRTAKVLADEIYKIPQVKITQKVETNAVFAEIPQNIISELQKSYFFYVWNEENSEVRWMTSYNTRIEDISGFVMKLKELLK